MSEDQKQASQPPVSCENQRFLPENLRYRIALVQIAIYLISIKSKVDSDAYITILKEHAIAFPYMREPSQHDNAPVHTSLKTEVFLGKWFHNSGKLVTAIS